MTLKSYLRMLLAAVTLLFVTSGCNDDDNKVGPLIRLVSLFRM